MIVTDEEAGKFCGDWSVGTRSARIVVGEIAADAWLWKCQSQNVSRYVDQLRKMLAHYDAVKPDYEDLPYWRECLDFWERVEAGAIHKAHGEATTTGELAAQLFEAVVPAGELAAAMEQAGETVAGCECPECGYEWTPNEYDSADGPCPSCGKAAETTVV